MHRPRLRDRTVSALAALLASGTMVAGAAVDPFEFFRPTVTLTADDHRQLDRGEAVVRILPGVGRELAVFASVPVRVDGDRLVAWVRRIDALKKSAYVPAIGRFSDPPRIEDLADLVLDEDEVAQVRACRPGRCTVNVTPAEAAELGRSQSQEAAQDAFRRIVLRRVQAYLAGHQAPGTEPPGSGDAAAAVLAELVRHSEFLTARLPLFANDLQHAQPTTTPDVESFLYWSRERLAGRAVVGVTDVSIWRGHEPGEPEVLVVGREFFATHYIRGSLGVTALVRGAGGAGYLVYLNRSSVDVLSGMWGGLVRWVVQRRLKGEAADVLQGLRRRLESGDPPPVTR